MSIQGFRGNCDSQASWGCAPALPNRIQMIFPRQATGKKLFFRLRLVAYSQSSKKAAASSQEVAAFLQNILKIKGIIAKLFYTFYSLNFIIFLFSVAYINCFYSIRCVFNTSKIIDY